MANPGLPRKIARQTYEAVQRLRSLHLAAAELGVNYETFRSRYRIACQMLNKPPVELVQRRRPKASDTPRPAADFEVVRVSQTLDAAGNLLREHVRSENPRGEAFDPLPGHLVKGESALVDADGRIMQKWVKTREGAIGAGLVEAMQDAFASYRGMIAPPPPPTINDGDLLTLYPLPDLHFGMLAWGKESGADYDIRIATDMALRAMAGLVAQSRPSKRAILLGLGDYFHSNDATAVTPRGGHKLDVDGRWPKVFSGGARLLVQLIEMLAAKHAEVEVVLLPGNHDPDAAVSLQVAMGMLFEAVPGVRVHDGHGLAWYATHGQVLLGATHGHTMRPQAMAMMLAHDMPEAWGRATHRHFFFGHIHHKTAEEVGPVVVESFASPAARDAYTAGAGYRSGRSLSAITFHWVDGEVGRHRVNLGHKRARGRVQAGRAS